MRTRTGGRFFITHSFMHVFSLLKVATVLPFPKLSYNSFKAKRRGGLRARAQLGRRGPMAGSCGWVPGMKGLKGVGVGRMKSLIDQRKFSHSLEKNKSMSTSWEAKDKQTKSVQTCSGISLRMPGAKAPGALE